MHFSLFRELIAQAAHVPDLSFAGFKMLFIAYGLPLLQVSHTLQRRNESGPVSVDEVETTASMEDDQQKGYLLQPNSPQLEYQLYFKYLLDELITHAYGSRSSHEMMARDKHALTKVPSVDQAQLPQCCYTVFCLYVMQAMQPFKQQKLLIPLPYHAWSIMEELLTQFKSHPSTLHAAHVLAKMLREKVFEFVYDLPRSQVVEAAPWQLEWEAEKEEEMETEDEIPNVPKPRLSDPRWYRSFAQDLDELAAKQTAVFNKLSSPPPVHLDNLSVDLCTVIPVVTSVAQASSYDKEFERVEHALPVPLQLAREQMTQELAKKRTHRKPMVTANPLVAVASSATTASIAASSTVAASAASSSSSANSLPIGLSKTPHEIFLSEFAQEYGPCIPDFATGSYQDAAREAKERGRLLFIYLHNSTHRDTKTFLRETLCTEPLCHFLRENYVSWAGTMTHPDAYRLCQQFSVATFPFIAIQAPPNLSLVWQHSGLIQREALMVELSMAVASTPISPSAIIDSLEPYKFHPLPVAHIVPRTAMAVNQKDVIPVLKDPSLLKPQLNRRLVPNLEYRLDDAASSSSVATNDIIDPSSQTDQAFLVALQQMMYRDHSSEDGASAAFDPISLLELPSHPHQPLISTPLESRPLQPIHPNLILEPDEDLTDVNDDYDQWYWPIETHTTPPSRDTESKVLMPPSHTTFMQRLEEVRAGYVKENSQQRVQLDGAGDTTSYSSSSYHRHRSSQPSSSPPPPSSSLAATATQRVQQIRSAKMQAANAEMAALEAAKRVARGLPKLLSQTTTHLEEFKQVALEIQARTPLVRVEEEKKQEIDVHQHGSQPAISSSSGRGTDKKDILERMQPPSKTYHSLLSDYLHRTLMVKPTDLLPQAINEEKKDSAADGHAIVRQPSNVVGPALADLMSFHGVSSILRTPLNEPQLPPQRTISSLELTGSTESEEKKGVDEPSSVDIIAPPSSEPSTAAVRRPVKRQNKSKTAASQEEGRSTISNGTQQIASSSTDVAAASTTTADAAATSKLKVPRRKRKLPDVPIFSSGDSTVAPSTPIAAAKTAPAEPEPEPSDPEALERRARLDVLKKFSQDAEAFLPSSKFDHDGDGLLDETEGHTKKRKYQRKQKLPSSSNGTDTATTASSNASHLLSSSLTRPPPLRDAQTRANDQVMAQFQDFMPESLRHVLVGSGASPMTVPTTPRTPATDFITSPSLLAHPSPSLSSVTGAAAPSLLPPSTVIGGKLAPPTRKGRKKRKAEVVDEESLPPTVPSTPTLLPTAAPILPPMSTALTAAVSEFALSQENAAPLRTKRGRPPGSGATKKKITDETTITAASTTSIAKKVTEDRPSAAITSDAVMAAAVVASSAPASTSDIPILPIMPSHPVVDDGGVAPMDIDVEEDETPSPATRPASSTLHTDYWTDDAMLFAEVDSSLPPSFPIGPPVQTSSVVRVLDEMGEIEFDEADADDQAAEHQRRVIEPSNEAATTTTTQPKKTTRTTKKTTKKSSTNVTTTAVTGAALATQPKPRPRQPRKSSKSTVRNRSTLSADVLSAATSAAASSGQFQIDPNEFSSDSSSTTHSSSQARLQHLLQVKARMAELLAQNDDDDFE